MKQVHVHGPDDVRLDNVERPAPGPRDAILEVVACGICGSDLRYVRLGGLAGPTRSPMPLGHELSGVIESIGSEVEGLAPGMRVVLNPMMADALGNGGSEGGFTPRLLVRNAKALENLFEVPEDLPMDLAALAEPLGVGMNAADRVDPTEGDKIAVFGAGPIGLAAIASLRDRGIEDICAIDLSKRRLEIARELGAAATIDASNEDPFTRLRVIHGERHVLGAPMIGTNAYIEASGAGPVISQIIQHAAAEARISVVALHDTPIQTSFLLVMMKQLSIRGAMLYPDDFSESLGLLGRRDLSAMITHRFPLEQFRQALDTARDPQSGGKVLIQIGQE
ncbi:MAG: zinc-binding dehydrogenase [bacterium]|nr:zinc-binding dehydrogenase [bacterium]